MKEEKEKEKKLKELVTNYVKIKKELSHLSKLEATLKKEILNLITNEKVLKGLNDETIVIMKRLIPEYDPKILFEIIDREKFLKIVKILNTEAEKVVDDFTLNKALKDIKEITVLKIL